VGDDELLVGLRVGDEDAFAELFRTYHGRLLRLAESFVGSRAVAEEVVQDTWVGVIRGLPGFEGRSTLRTWIFHILANRARSTAVREHRSEPIDVAATPERFDATGAWAAPPEPWTDRVDDRVVAERLAARVRGCLEDLPDAQRRVVLLRDVEGMDATQACAVLGINDGHHRVLLHRGRRHIRQCLADEMGRASA
jgi:RNA polymerase sigma-70 factor (ECF subfamily)